MFRVDTALVFLSSLLAGIQWTYSSTTEVSVCSGEILTLNCTLNSRHHIWNIAALDERRLVTRFERNVLGSQYNISIVNESTRSIVSALSLVITDDLNGTTVTCEDAFNKQVIQITAITVLGSPTPPHLIVEALSFDTLEFLISPLSEPSECILHYIITPTSGDETELPDIVATVVAGQQFAAVNASGFALCNDTYEFTAAAVTLRGVGNRSDVATPDEIELSMQFSVVIGFTDQVYEFTKTDSMEIVAVISFGVLRGKLKLEVPITLDIESLNYNEMFAINSSSSVVNISINIPLSLEEVEAFTARLTFAETPPLCVALAPDTAVIISPANSVITGAIVGSVTALIIVIIIIIILSVSFAAAVKKNRTVLSKKLNQSGKKKSSNERNIELRIVHDMNSHLPIVKFNQLKLDETIGQGEFGIVYKAYLSEGHNKSGRTLVAVKTLKGALEHSYLLEECAKMTEFNHPNVLSLIGVCLDGGPAPFIVMPFMHNGSLIYHLKREQDTLVLPPQEQPDSATVNNTLTELLGMSIQVAKGMEFLSIESIIHGDLAARNCMIDENFVIKVADFGFSEIIDPSREHHRRNMSNTNTINSPVKWMAPECLNGQKFSEKSDVWAFGVTCWEIFSGGKIPYAGIHPGDLPLMIKRGNKLEKPDNAACVSEVYYLMYRCWANRPKDRLTFSEIVVELSQILDSLSGIINYKGAYSYVTA